MVTPSYIATLAAMPVFALDFAGFGLRQVFDAVSIPIIVALIALMFFKVRSANREHQDLIEARAALEDAAERQTILRAVSEHANDGLVYQDLSARILWANTAYCNTMGWQLEEILGRKPQEFCFPPDVKPSKAEIDNFRFDVNDITFKELHRHPNIRKNGERFWHEFSQAVVDLPGGEQRVILVSRDVSLQVAREQELERIRSDLHHAANHDALTDLASRSAFLKATDELLEKAQRASDLGLLYIDLDQFKAVNDTYGHAAGDAILVHVAESINEVTRSCDIACRMGGDEFVIACPKLGDFNALQHVADLLLDRIRMPIRWGDSTLTCGASIGIAVNDPTIQTAEDLIRSADFALYEAKAAGAPNIVRYDGDLHARQEAEKALLQEFSDALDADAISFDYQPVMDARSGKICSFETLARWHREDGSVLGPDEFLPFASRLNRMAELDFAAIRAAASLTAELAQRGHRIRGAFNTSSEALAHPEFLTRLARYTSDANLSHADLTAEVLETTFFGPDTHDSLAAARIRQLRDLGYQVYLDDFGVGYAGLAHLGQLDITGIKLDRSLVANITNDKSARIIATSILRLCHELGVGALAEGIEASEQAEFLTARGCYLLQGFGIGRPMGRADLIQVIEAGRAISIPAQSDANRLAG